MSDRYAAWRELGQYLAGALAGSVAIALLCLLYAAAPSAWAVVG